MAEDFTGKAGIVTGAGSGIGRSAAIGFAEAGAQVVIVDVDEDGSNATKAMIDQLGGEVICVSADISQEAAVEKMVAETVATYGKLDFAFNNAGIAGDIVPLIDYTEELWDRVIGINLKGVWLCMKHQIRQMLEQGQDANGDGQVEMGPCLQHIGRGQIDGDALWRQRKADSAQCRTNPFAGLRHRLVGQTNDGERRQTGCHLNLNIDAYNVDPLKSDGVDTGNHGKVPKK